MARRAAICALIGLATVVAGCKEPAPGENLTGKLQEYCEVAQYTPSQCDCAQAEMSAMSPERLESVVLYMKAYQENLAQRASLGLAGYTQKMFEKAGVQDLEVQRQIIRQNTEIADRTASLCSIDYKKFLNGLVIGRMHGDSYRSNLWRQK